MKAKKTETGPAELATRPGPTRAISQRKEKKPALDISLANLIPVLVSFLGTLNIVSQVLTATLKKKTIFNADEPDVFGRVPACRCYTVACVVVPEISAENIDAAMVAAAYRTKQAVDGYLATASIAGGADLLSRLKVFSEKLGIGVILLDTSAKANKTRIILPIQAPEDDNALHPSSYQMPTRPKCDPEIFTAFFDAAALYNSHQLGSATNTVLDGHSCS